MGGCQWYQERHLDISCKSLMKVQHQCLKYKFCECSIWQSLMNPVYLY